MINLLLAEDQRMLRQALVEIFSREPDLKVVAECSAVAEVLPALRSKQVDVAVLDIEFPDGMTLDILDQVTELTTGVVLVTVFGRPGYLKRAASHESVSFVLKDSAPRALADVIRKSANGERVIDPQLAVSALSAGDSPLTRREAQVLSASRGIHSSAELAKTLHLSVGTIRNTLSSAIQKLHASSRTEAARIAENNGWI